MTRKVFLKRRYINGKQNGKDILTFLIIMEMHI